MDFIFIFTWCTENFRRWYFSNVVRTWIRYCSTIISTTLLWSSGCVDFMQCRLPLRGLNVWNRIVIFFNRLQSICVKMIEIITQCARCRWFRRTASSDVFRHWNEIVFTVLFRKTFSVNSRQWRLTCFNFYNQIYVFWIRKKTCFKLSIDLSLYKLTVG